jgi:transcriptional regulator with XRE-family HTH domain
MSPATFRKRVAARIQRARWRLGWTQSDAAHRVGLTFRYFAEIERARRNPTLDVLFAIARGLKVRVADLVDVEPGAKLDLDRLDVEPPKTGRKPSGSPR